MTNRISRFISNITPSLVPHEEFHKGIWLNTMDVPWYYFFKKDRIFQIPENKHFYKTLDQDLKPIVYLLHKNGIPTTPSCSGHFYEKDHYTSIYDSLLRNGDIIRNKGISLINQESGTCYFFQSNMYKLPWNKEEFLNSISNYQKRGVLGFVDAGGHFYNSIKDPSYHTIRDKDLTLIIIESSNKKECSEKWSNIKQILSKKIN